jgi:hypothetical protein
MNGSSAVALIRRRLNERVEADGWDDDALYVLLNEGIKFVQKKVIAVDPYAFVTISHRDTVVGSAGEFYEVPPGMWYEIEVGFKSAASQALYTPLGKGNYHILRSRTTGTTQYARYGNYFAIWPNPAAAVTSGLRVHFMPTLSMGEKPENATNVIPLHPAMHMAAVIRAVMYALGDTLESRSELSTELAQELIDIPEYYHSGGDPQQVRVDFGKTLY